MTEEKSGPGRGFGEDLFADGGESVRALMEEVVQALIGGVFPASVREVVG